jgi:hypothetical protein
MEFSDALGIGAWSIGLDDVDGSTKCSLWVYEYIYIYIWILWIDYTVIYSILDSKSFEDLKWHRSRAGACGSITDTFSRQRSASNAPGYFWPPHVVSCLHSSYACLIRFSWLLPNIVFWVCKLHGIPRDWEQGSLQHETTTFSSASPNRLLHWSRAN